MDQLPGFHPTTRTYAVATSLGSMVVRAQADDPDAEVSYTIRVGRDTVDSGVLGIGGGETTADIPSGSSVLSISVISRGLVGRYTVELLRYPGLPCTEQGVLQAFSRTGGPYGFDCQGPTTVVMGSEILAETDVMLDGEGDLVIEATYYRVMSVAPGAVVQLTGMELRDGTADYGGGVYNEGLLTLVDVRVMSNRARERGGGVYSAPGSQLVLDGVTVGNNLVSGLNTSYGGGLYLDDSVALIADSVVQDNIVRGWSAQSGRDARGGGLFVSGGQLYLDASSIAGNSALGGDGSGDFSSAGRCRGGGMELQNATALIVDSTVSGNECHGGYAYRGGGFASGGGIVQEAGTLTIRRTTIDNNLAEGVTGPWDAGAGGGVYVWSDAFFVATNTTLSGNRADYYEAASFGHRTRATFYNCTIAFNSTDASHSALGTDSDSHVSFRHSIVWNEGRCVGVAPSSGYNVFGPNDGCGSRGDAVGDTISVHPPVEPLADNGGPTLTHALVQASAARDAGDPNGCTDEDGWPLPHDQRGEARPSSTCDIGAVEMASP